MKNYIFSISILIASNFVFAQGNASKIVLSNGQKIMMLSNDTTNISQKRGEDNMDMKAFSSSKTEIEIITAEADGYKAIKTLKSIKINFDGFGQKMIYDSEDAKKQEGIMADQLKNVLNKADTILISNEGKLIEEDDKNDKAKKGKGGMIKMMNQGGGNVENAFLVVPSDAKEGSGWKVDGTKDGVRSQTIYFVEKLDGNIATLSFKKKTKGVTSHSGGQGGDIKVDLDNLSNGMLTVDLKTALVKRFYENTDTKSKTTMMGQDIPSTGKVMTEVRFE